MTTPYTDIISKLEEQELEGRPESPDVSPIRGDPLEGGFVFRLTENPDPEERLEEAALWKAMHDVFGRRIRYTTADDEPADYGRLRRFSREPRSVDIDYWNDQAFLKHAGRRFWTGSFEDAGAEVAKLHADGLGAFVKSTRAKHWIERIPVGTSLAEAATDMAFSFIDGGPPIMVQELATVRYEHRFFVVGRRVVTSSPNAAHLTPLDYGQVFYDYETPSDYAPSMFNARGFLLGVAEDIARTMAQPDAVIDCALINGKPGCVEINPLIIGGVGLFACDVRALASAIHQRDVTSALERRRTASSGRNSSIQGPKQ